MGLKDVTGMAMEVAGRAQRRLFLGLVAWGMGLVAFGFGNAALFLAMLPGLGALRTCAVLAVIYALAAAFVLAVTRREQDRVPPPAARLAEPRAMSDDDAIGHLVATFLAALRATRGP